MLGWVNAAMAAAAAAAMAGLVAEYGFELTSDAIQRLHALEAGAAYLFCALQVSKLFLAARPLREFRRARLEYGLLFILGFQLLAAAGLEAAPEHAYLSRHGNPAPLAAVTVLVVQAYILAVAALRSHWLQDALFRLRLHPAQTLVASFVLLIGGGAALLCLPKASAPGRAIAPLDALFTAASAACVTGLTVLDTGTDFSTLGQCVILALIQIGGLGILTMTAFAALIGGRGVLGSQAKEMGRLLEVETVPQIRRVLVGVFGITFGAEALGALLLYPAMTSRVEDGYVGGFYAIFHSVSAFCNAGFALFPDSLASFKGHSSAMAVFTALISAGALGPVVLERLPGAALSAFRGRGPQVSRHVRVVLSVSAGLVLFGASALWLLERGGALASWSAEESFWGAVFLPVTARTCGFDLGYVSALGTAASCLLVGLMFIGGSPASTAGGVKTTTLAVGWAVLRGRLSGRAPMLAGRNLTGAELGKTAWVAGGLLIITAVSASALMLSEGEWSLRLLVETVSAAATVGLSQGVTPGLTAAGKVIVILAMLFGRVGPACLVLLWTLRHPDEKTTPDSIGAG